MEKSQQALHSPDRSTSHPTDESDQIKEAKRLREKLESLGVWGNKGSKVRNPHYPLPPESEPQRQPIQNSIQL